MIGLSNGPGFTPQKPQFFEEKMLRLLEIFFLKNSSPFFLKPWKVGASNINILLIGAIKNYNFFYCHFLIRPFLSKIFAGPSHQAKAKSSSRTVIFDFLSRQHVRLELLLVQRDQHTKERPSRYTLRRNVLSAGSTTHDLSYLVSQSADDTRQGQARGYGHVTSFACRPLGANTSNLYSSL